MLWWLIGGAVAVFVIGGAGWWFVNQVARRLPAGVREAELAGRSERELLSQIDRILRANRAAEADTFEQVSPGIVVFAAPTWREKDGGFVARSLTLLPEPFHTAYYGEEASRALDRDEVREVIAAAAGSCARDPRLVDPLYDIAETYEGDVHDAPEVAGELRYEPGDRALSLLIADVARCLSAGATLDEVRGRWGLADDPKAHESLEEKLHQLTQREGELFARAVEGQDANLGAAGDGPETTSAAVRPRFFTAGRRARHDALMEAVMAQTGVDAANVERPPELQVEIPGLPHPIDFVLDLGTHVMPLQEPVLDGESVSLSALRVLAVENLRLDGDAPPVPNDDEVLTLHDDADHGAVRVLLMPEALGDDETCLVVAPSHGALILFPDGVPERAREAKATFDQMLAEGDGDPPLPSPVRVSARGFETLSWDELEG